MSIRTPEPGRRAGQQGEECYAIRAGRAISLVAFRLQTAEQIVGLVQRKRAAFVSLGMQNDRALLAHRIEEGLLPRGKRLRARDGECALDSCACCCADSSETKTRGH